MMKALVLGGEGMLGHKMFQVLGNQLGDVACTVRGAIDDPFYRAIPLFNEGHVLPRIDVMNRKQLRNTLQEIEPEFIVNCIGVIKQRPEASASIPSISINAMLPHELALWAEAWSPALLC